MRALRRLLAPTLLTILAAFSVGATGSCGDTITVDTATPSVPTIKLHVRANNVTVVAEGGQTLHVTARTGTRVDVLAVGDDPVGGVWQVGVYREDELNCIDDAGELGVRVNASILPEVYSSSATNGQQATTGAYVNQNVFATRCPSGFHPRSGGMYFTARARSFSSRWSALANVVVDVVP